MNTKQSAFDSRGNIIHVIGHNQTLIFAHGFSYDDGFCSSKKRIMKMNKIKTSETMKKRRKNSRISNMDNPRNTMNITRIFFYLLILNRKNVHVIPTRS